MKDCPYMPVRINYWVDTVIITGNYLAQRDKRKLQFSSQRTVLRQTLGILALIVKSGHHVTVDMI